MTPLPSPHLAGVTLRVARPDDAPDVALLRRHAARRSAPPGWAHGDAERVRSRLPRLALRAG